MYMVFDTEGSGLFDYQKPADAEGQPRLAEFTAIFADAEMNETARFHALVKPEGWIMPEETAKIHGLTQEKLLAEGRPVVDILKVYTKAIQRGYIAVAHNSQHDMKQLRAELRRANMPDLFENAPNICTMRALTDICKIPPNGNRGGYKFPKLSEAAVFFKMENLGDHSSTKDAEVCLALLRKLKELGKLPEAKVHFAKNPPAGKTNQLPSGDEA